MPHVRECSFYGRPIEPLAFYLPSFSNIYQQNQSRLYSIPKEIHDLIFEYALTEDAALSPINDHALRRNSKGQVSKVNSAISILQTCKAVYLEAYRLPMLLNGCLAYRINDYSSPHHTCDPL
ncbi:hypothetical protein BU23DRAFT_263928 [Bimuria novae-zelandiae CBS 107.79]|uniref:F-box domain-containing protein n=1 Tax=Bimuria novae-zelandiae CBS 107.79 TaxID=1447943 RepID=A0A6A5UZN5_9PLEO|nr:hypothetical protein BU23DRAFT_263928 [Bimuria novae-zelandiae CBS 107.79]